MFDMVKHKCLQCDVWFRYIVWTYSQTFNKDRVVLGLKILKIIRCVQGIQVQGRKIVILFFMSDSK